MITYFLKGPFTYLGKFSLFAVLLFKDNMGQRKSQFFVQNLRVKGRSLSIDAI